MKQRSWLKSINSHRCDANMAREVYRQQINETKDVWKKFSEEERYRILTNLSAVASPIRQKPCSGDITMHYSFDFAQQVGCN